MHKYGGQWDGAACTVYQYLSKLAFRLQQDHDGDWSVIKAAPSNATQGALEAQQAGHEAQDAGELQLQPEWQHDAPQGDQMHEALQWHRIGLWGSQQGEPAFMPVASEYAPHIALLHARDPALLGEQIRGIVYVGATSADRMYVVGAVLVVMGLLGMVPVLVMGLMSMLRRQEQPAAAAAPARQGSGAWREQQLLQQQFERRQTLDKELDAKLALRNMRVEVECSFSMDIEDEL